MRRLATVGILALGACSPSPPTQVLVWFDIEEGSALEADAASVSVRVLDQSGTLRLDSGGTLQGPPPVLSLPSSISVRPLDEDAARRFRVELTLFDDAGSELATQRAEAGFVDGEVREIRLRFSDACAGITCSPARTCIDGACPRACFEARVLGDARPSQPSLCPTEQCSGDACEGGVCIPAAPVQNASAGDNHTCAIVEGGALYCWGANRRGQLGIGDAGSQSSPVRLALPAPATSVEAGAAHTCAILDDATLHCWGANDAGQLGVDGEDRFTPVQVPLPTGSEVALVTTGTAHTCAALTDQSLYCWGDNGRGQLGTGSSGSRLPPTEVPRPAAAMGTIAQIGAGDTHTCMRLDIGRLWCWGGNSNGELGLGDRVDRPTAEQVEWTIGFTALAVGSWHTCALGENGELFCFGDVSNGRLGFDMGDVDNKQTVPKRVMEDRDWRGGRVATGRRHSCAVDADQIAWCFGTSTRGELGVGPVGAEEDGPLALVDRGWTSLALGNELSCGTRGDPGAWTLFCWGANDAGQLGLGISRESQTEPQRVCFPGTDEGE